MGLLSYRNIASFDKKYIDCNNSSNICDQSLKPSSIAPSNWATKHVKNT